MNTKDDLIKEVIPYVKYKEGHLYKVKLWNKKGPRNLNKRLGCKDNSGRFVFKFKYKNLYVHRVIWALFNDFPLPEMIDHIDGNMSNNRIENLRASNNRHNQQNQKIHRNGKLPGTHFRRGKWEAQATIPNKKSRWLGAYNSEQEAHDAYIEAIKEIRD